MKARGRRGREQSLQALPDEWPHSLLEEIRGLVRASGEVLAVLDDDPTGTQTVADVTVLTTLEGPALRDELGRGEPLFYLLTNSRSLPPQEAGRLNYEIGANLAQAARQAGRGLRVISRSDSTLRGHFPGEVEALGRGLGVEFDAWLIVPFFLEGGRYTLEDVHYVAQDDWLVPAGETEFARDRAFGYRASDLKDWVEEKTGGQVRAGQVASLSIDEIRLQGPEQILRRLMALQGGQMCVVNAASYRDLEVVALAALRAEALGKRFVYRTAASFVRVRAGLEPRGLLQAQDFDLPPAGGGLVIAGSYVPRSTGQIQALLEDGGVIPVEVQAAALLDQTGRGAEIARAAQRAEQGLREERVVLAYTSRDLLAGDDSRASLEIGQQVSAGLVEILKRINVRPRYLVAKGGITSSDLATRGLGVKRARVMGQILPGVPAWRLGEESRFPGLVYVVFPGNVGERDALAEVVRIFGSPVR